MDQITNTFNNIYAWAKNDYKAWPLRFCLEIIAWFGSITCSVIMALTVPNPPFLLLYPMFIAQCMIFGWAAWTRKSTGMVANYGLLVTIDIIALTRLLLT
jgi:hypothetical protein